MEGYYIEQLLSTDPTRVISSIINSSPVACTQMDYRTSIWLRDKFQRGKCRSEFILPLHHYEHTGIRAAFLQSHGVSRLKQHFTTPNFGCVIATPFGFITGEGFHYAQGTTLAEVQTMGAVGKRCRGATAYLNMEPGDCNSLVLQSEMESQWIKVGDGGGAMVLVVADSFIVLRWVWVAMVMMWGRSGGGGGDGGGEVWEGTRVRKEFG